MEPRETRPPAERGIYCNRTLNLRAIEAIGYDMDYTLVHYRVEAWERHAYEHLQRNLAARGWPVQDLRFDAQMMVRGLIVDIELGNIVKANRFGYVKQAVHGTRPLHHDELRRTYALTLTDLSQGRFVFVNTLFSLSEVCMYAQLVDLLDAGQIPELLSYAKLYREVRRSLDEAHWKGAMKAEILTDPDRFIELDPEAALALRDQQEAGKRLLLITNSEWHYARAVMSYAFDRYLPKSKRWRDLFELTIVAARKPSFFSGQAPMFEIVQEDGLLRPVIDELQAGGLYHGGHAALVESYLGLAGDRILYVGDHIFVDVNVSKNLLKWRTALVLWELEQEVSALSTFAEQQRRLNELMEQKEGLELELARQRLLEQRAVKGYGPRAERDASRLRAQALRLREQIQRLDEQIAPIAQAAGQLCNPRWGLLMRTGRDKSHLARQVERYADIYTSRVANFAYRTPFAFFQSPRGSLPHDASG